MKSKADRQGRFTLESTWTAWKDWEFGQKREPSRWLTLLACRIIGNVQTSSGQSPRQDYEYERNGTANIFIAVEPLLGKRKTFVTDQRTHQDFAELLRYLSDEEYPEVEKIVLVTDNLNTHSPACLYQRFEPAEARRLAQRFEWHYTPEHGSWLNMAEIELSILSRQCTNRRIPDQPTLAKEVAAWERDRNKLQVQINWQFKAEDARIKLKRLYPVAVVKYSS